MVFFDVVGPLSCYDAGPSLALRRAEFDRVRMIHVYLWYDSYLQYHESFVSVQHSRLKLIGLIATNSLDLYRRSFTYQRTKWQRAAR